jgi:hypothetical protein
MDKLNLDFINSLPQPLMAISWGDRETPVHDIDVQTGLVRLDVSGMLDIMDIADFKAFRDLEGTVHDSETFYLEEAQS